jgi:hypothetical protein
VNKAQTKLYIPDTKVPIKIIKDPAIIAIKLLSPAEFPVNGLFTISKTLYLDLP